MTNRGRPRHRPQATRTPTTRRPRRHGTRRSTLRPHLMRLTKVTNTKTSSTKANLHHLTQRSRTPKRNHKATPRLNISRINSTTRGRPRQHHRNRHVNRPRKHSTITPHRRPHNSRSSRRPTIGKRTPLPRSQSLPKINRMVNQFVRRRRPRTPPRRRPNSSPNRRLLSPLKHRKYNPTPRTKATRRHSSSPPTTSRPSRVNRHMPTRHGITPRRHSNRSIKKGIKRESRQFLTNQTRT